MNLAKGLGVVCQWEEDHTSRSCLVGSEKCHLLIPVATSCSKAVFSCKKQAVPGMPVMVTYGLEL